MRQLLITGLLLSAAASSARAIEPGTPPGNPTSQSGVPGDGFEGAWLGELWAPAGKLRVFVRLFETDGRVTGSLDSLDQHVRGLELQSALTFGTQLRFDLAKPQASFEGRMNPEGAEIVGRWKQEGSESWLVLRRLSGHPAAP